MQQTEPLISFGWPQIILLICLYAIAEGFKLLREREVKRELAETKKELAAAAKVEAAQLSEIQTTVTKTDHRSNSLTQIHLGQAVDLFEEILELKPGSESAKAKLAAARQRLADHIEEEELMAKQAALEERRGREK